MKEKLIKTRPGWNSQLQKLPIEDDIQNIVDYYWDTFKTQFPKVTQDTFTKWITEDTFGGWEDYDHMHAGGRRELKMLYATIRASKPKSILEIGTCDGASTQHILLAAKNNSKEGFPCEVTTVDISDYLSRDLKSIHPVTRLVESSLDHLQEYTHYEFIFQDGDHSPFGIAQELDLFRQCQDLQVLFSHDYFLRKEIKYTFDNYPMVEMFNNIQSYKEEAYSAGFLLSIK